MLSLALVTTIVAPPSFTYIRQFPHEAPLFASSFCVEHGDIDGDGLDDLVTLPRDAGSAKDIAVAFQGIRSRSTALLFQPSTCVAVDTKRGNDTSALMLSANLDEVFAWRWDGNHGQLFPSAPHLGTWSGETITALDVDAGPGTDRYVLVGTEDHMGIDRVHLSTFDGASFVGVATFIAADDIREVHLLDDGSGGGRADWIAVCTDDQVEVLDLSGVPVSTTSLGTDTFVASAEAPYDGSADRLVIASQGASQAHIRELQPGLAVSTGVFAGWTVVGLDVADTNEDGLQDVVVTRMSPSALTVIQKSAGEPYQPLDAEDLFSRPVGPLTAPCLRDGDGDGDADLSWVSSWGVVNWECDATDSNDFRPDAVGTGDPAGSGEGGGAYPLSIVPIMPSSVTWDAERHLLAWRVYSQEEFDPNGALVDHPDLGGTQTGEYEELLVEIDLEEPDHVNFIQLYIVDTQANNRAYPFASFAATTDDLKRDEVCDFFDMSGNTCEPKDSIGIIRIEFIPPPTPPGPPPF